MRPRKIRASPGMRFGHLTVLRQVGRASNGSLLFECKCDCGEVVSIRETHFYPTRRFCTRRCPLLSDHRSTELEGQRIGRWTVKSRQGSDDRNEMKWRCVCDCGTERTLSGVLLTSGESQSCGCAQKEALTKYKTAGAKLEAKRRNSRVCAHKNPARVKANKIKYESQLKRATPAWLTADDWAAMNALYEEARRLTRETGIKHQVDHKIPLNGKTISGLHVPGNLQVLTQSANVSKSNRYAELLGD